MARQKHKLVPAVGATSKEDNDDTTHPTSVSAASISKQDDDDTKIATKLVGATELGLVEPIDKRLAKPITTILPGNLQPLSDNINKPPQSTPAATVGMIEPIRKRLAVTSMTQKPMLSAKDTTNKASKVAQATLGLSGEAAKPKQKKPKARGDTALSEWDKKPAPKPTDVKAKGDKKPLKPKETGDKERSASGIKPAPKSTTAKAKGVEKTLQRQALSDSDKKPKARTTRAEATKDKKSLQRQELPDTDVVDTLVAPDIVATLPNKHWYLPIADQTAYDSDDSILLSGDIEDDFVVDCRLTPALFQFGMSQRTFCLLHEIYLKGALSTWHVTESLSRKLVEISPSMHLFPARLCCSLSGNDLLRSLLKESLESTVLIPFQSLVDESPITTCDKIWLGSYFRNSHSAPLESTISTATCVATIREAICSFFVAQFPALRRGHAKFIEEDFTSVEQSLGNNEFLFMFAVDPKKKNGYAIIAAVLFGRFQSGLFVSWFAVQENYRSHGIGRFLLTYLQASSVIINKSIDVYLQVNVDKTACDIYKHWDFIQLDNKKTLLPADMQASYEEVPLGQLVTTDVPYIHFVDDVESEDVNVFRLFRLQALLGRATKNTQNLFRWCKRPSPMKVFESGIGRILFSTQVPKAYCFAPGFCQINRTILERDFVRIPFPILASRLSDASHGLPCLGAMPFWYSHTNRLRFLPHKNRTPDEEYLSFTGNAFVKMRTYCLMQHSNRGLLQNVDGRNLRAYTEWLNDESMNLLLSWISKDPVSPLADQFMILQPMLTGSIVQNFTDLPKEDAYNNSGVLHKFLMDHPDILTKRFIFLPLMQDGHWTVTVSVNPWATVASHSTVHRK